MKALLATSICLAAAGILAYSALPDPTAKASIHIADSRVKSAMKYHGIRFCIHEGTKSGAYFYRDGQKCQLFTKAFVRKETRR